MSHVCHADGCEVEVPPKLFMCRRHWYTLPGRIRSEIWRCYRPGQEEDKHPSAHYLEVTGTAKRWLAEHEAKNPSLF